MKYKVEAEILTVVSCFENGSIPRENWKHAEHLTVALYYILNSKSLSDACDKMRGGIFNLLKSFQIDLSKDMPYHETLTVFWIRTIADFTKSKNDASIVEICNALIENFDKDYPLKFYSRETLFSDEARKFYIKADLKDVNENFAFDYKSLSHQN